MKRRVVLIEDEKDVADLLVRDFSRLAPDWELVPCGTMRSGREACAGPTDLIILDLALPDSTSDDSVELISMLAYAAPVEVLSGRTLRGTDTFDRCFANGASDVWEKTSLRGEGIIFFVQSCNAAIARREIRQSHEQRH